jgi:hypothetical protein
MNTDFLLQNRDEQILDNYLKLLAFSVQKPNSYQELIQLKLENKTLKEENSLLKSMLESHLDELFEIATPEIKSKIYAKIQQDVLNTASNKMESLLKTGTDKMTSFIEKKLNK